MSSDSHPPVVTDDDDEDAKSRPVTSQSLASGMIGDYDEEEILEEEVEDDDDGSEEEIVLDTDDDDDILEEVVDDDDFEDEILEESLEESILRLPVLEEVDEEAHKSAATLDHMVHDAMLQPEPLVEQAVLAAMQSEPLEQVAFSARHEPSEHEPSQHEPSEREPEPAVVETVVVPVASVSEQPSEPMQDAPLVAGVSPIESEPVSTPSAAETEDLATEPSSKHDDDDRHPIAVAAVPAAAVLVAATAAAAGANQAPTEERNQDIFRPPPPPPTQAGVIRPPSPMMTQSIYSLDEEEPSDELGERTADEMPGVAVAATSLGVGTTFGIAAMSSDDMSFETPVNESMETIESLSPENEQLDAQEPARDLVVDETGEYDAAETEEAQLEAENGEEVAAESGEPKVDAEAAASEAAVTNDREAERDVEMGDVDYNEDDYVYKDEELDEEVQRRRRPTGFDVIVLLVGLGVVIAIAIILPVVFFGRGDSSPTTPFPTSSPTFAPTPPPSGLQGYVIAAGPFQGPSASNFGSSVSIFGTVAVVGAPDTASGSVSTYMLQGMNWTQVDFVLEGPEQNAKFGISADINLGGMIVGAPGVLAVGTTAPVGAAYFYGFNEDSLRWTLLGNVLRGVEDIDAVNEQFGFSVARSNIFRVVIGAPGRRQGDGGVYTFQLSQQASDFTWVRMGDPIAYLDTMEALGHAVDMNQLGDTIVVGAPSASNGNGRCLVYRWNETNSTWGQTFEVAGSSGARLGTSVVMLSDNGKTFAVGAPGSGGGSILVYRQMDGSSDYQQLGPSITGSSGETLGSEDSIDGMSGSSTYVVAGTANGSVKRFTYDAVSNNWRAVYEAFDSGIGPVTSIRATNDLATLGVGFSAQDEALILQRTSRGRTSAPSSAPTQQPIAPSATPRPSIAPTQQPIAPSATPRPSIAPVATFSPSGGTAAPSVRLTSVPTVAPVSVTPVATPQPSPPPSMPPATTTAPSSTPAGLQWQATAGFTGDSGSNLGASVSLSSSAMAAGSSSTSLVKTYALGANGWIFSQDIVGEGSGTMFGTSVDLNPNGLVLLVGAPLAPAQGTTTPTGAAYFYSQSSGSWTQQGGAIRGDSTQASANEYFGYSVATSPSGVVAVGAPFSNNDDVSIQQRGKVYTFVYDSSQDSWIPRSSTSSVNGLTALELLGSSVAVSNDGNTLVAGAPGANSGMGAVFIYQWSGSDWTVVSSFNGESSSESLGSSVTVLSSDGSGSRVAAGGFGYDSGKGVIRVYEIQNGAYSALGSPIVGNASESLGASMSLAGSGDSILGSTATGSVRSFQYNGVDWQYDVIPPVATGFNSVPAVSGSRAFGNFVAGRNNQVNIYSLVQS